MKNQQDSQVEAPGTETDPESTQYQSTPEHDNDIEFLESVTGTENY